MVLWEEWEVWEDEYWRRQIVEPLPRIVAIDRLVRRLGCKWDWVNMSKIATLHFDGTERYYLDPELKAIVNMALAMEKPLLLTGEAGTGKTQLALEVARALDLDTEILRAKSTIKGEEACYVQDTVCG